MTSTPAIVAAALVVMLAMSLVWFAQRNRNQAPPTALVPIKETPKVADQNQLAVNNEDYPVKSEVPPLPTDTKQGSHPDRIGNPARVNNNKVAQSGVKAIDYGVSPAEYIRQGEQRAGEVSLSAPLRPMIVSMQDDHGATYKISLPPVSFGAQRLVDNVVPVSSTNSRSW
jgi:hypothetical protein